MSTKWPFLRVSCSAQILGKIVVRLRHPMTVATCGGVPHSTTSNFDCEAKCGNNRVAKDFPKILRKKSEFS